MNPLRLQMTRLQHHLICKIHLPVHRSPSNGHEGHLVEEAVVVGENEAFYLKSASPDYLGGRCLEETGTSVSALKVVSALTRKSVNRVKNTAIGHKVQRKNPENVGTIGKRNHAPMSLRRVKNNASGSAVPVGCVIIACLSPTQQSSYEIIWRFRVTGYIETAVRKSSTHPDS